MKIRIFAFLLLALTINMSCRKATHKDMKVVRHCSGVYLKIRSKEYQVCNSDKLNGYVDGSLVKVTYQKVKYCQKDGIRCAEYHTNDGMVEILKIH